MKYLFGFLAGILVSLAIVVIGSTSANAEAGRYHGPKPPLNKCANSINPLIRTCA